MKWVLVRRDGSHDEATCAVFVLWLDARTAFRAAGPDAELFEVKMAPTVRAAIEAVQTKAARNVSAVGRTDLRGG